MGVFEGPMSLLDFLIIPFSILTGLALSHLHLPFLFICASWAVITWIFYLHTTYGLTLSFVVRGALSMAVKIFFRDIGYNGTHKIPETGPLIFVCAPHANQFLDPILVMGATTRSVGFLAAAKSMRRKWVGMFAKALNSIPVERPQDLATPGTGKVTTSGKTVLGDGTKFTTQLQIGWSLVLKGETYAIQTIESDHKLTISAALEEDVTNPINFQFAPKVDQNAVFDMVYNALRADKCVGIFPEGGSHDRTDLLPLKAGCTIMALGAMNKYPELNVRIIPVGLNYFNGHRFRSRAFIDIGDPIEIPKELVAAFGQGGAAKRDACGTLLDMITKSLHGVTCVVPDGETLQLMWAIRRLYQPSGMPLTTDQKLELTRRFEKGYEQMKDHPRVKAILPKVLDYNQQRQILGLHDYQVAKISDNIRFVVLARVIYRTFLLFFYAIFALPGFILNAPVAVFARVISQQKAAEALKASTVKIAGRDVLGTWKVMVAAALLPLCFFIYPLIAAIVGWYKGWGAIHTWAYFALLQPFIMYGSVRFVETGYAIAMSLRPLLYALTQHTAGKSIRSLRTELQKDIRDLVESLGPQVFGAEFEQMRVVKSDDIRKKSISARKHASLAEQAREDVPVTSTAPNPNMHQFPDLESDAPLASPRKVE